MADLAFPWTADTMRTILRKVNQPLDRPGQPSWDEEEWSQALNQAYGDLHREIANMDRRYEQVQVDVVIPAGTTSYALPARNKALRFARVLDANGRTRHVIRRGLPEEQSTEPGDRLGVYFPALNTILFSMPLTAAITVNLWYSAYYIPLIHGAVISGGGATAELEEYESVESSLYIGQSVLVYEGLGKGQERTVSGYNGATRTITVSVAWTSVPDDTSRLCSRPDLPWDAKDVFQNYVIACLYEKTDEKSHAKFMGLAQKGLNRMTAALNISDRQSPDQTYDQNLNGGWGDPAGFYNY